jgi:hypothetical protein
MKKQYTYQVGGISVSTREAARVIQRSFRDEIVAKGLYNPVPRIFQKIVQERVVR